MGSYSRMLNGVANLFRQFSGPRQHPAEVLSSRTLTKLLSKAPETALVNHVVKWGLLREQGRHLNTQVKPLDDIQMLASTHRISQPESGIYVARLSMKNGKHLSDDWNDTGAWKPNRFSLKEANERLF